jgi:hypothetical protein
LCIGHQTFSGLMLSRRGGTITLSAIAGPSSAGNTPGANTVSKTVTICGCF